MNQDLKIIKKYYGEKMMHLCRDLFSTILEQPGELSKILLDKFEPNKFLYNDIIEQEEEETFKNYIYNIYDKSSKENIIKIDKTPKELLEKAGYTLYECKTEEEIQYFKRYYKKGEELCTFKGNRLDRCHVFFAVKKDVDNIKRENFPTPRRQDEYGTSVISIQFTKDNSHTLSIKNRYNHTVGNPDSTFSNDLDNIIEGLTESFENEYGLVQKNKSKGFELCGYVLANDGKYYKFNYEINNIYYCPNNIIIDNFEVKRYPKEKYIVLDYFILDLSTGKIMLYDNEISDSFPETIVDINKIEIVKDNKNKNIIITKKNNNDIIITIDSLNNIIGLIDNNIVQIAKFYLQYNRMLKQLSMSSVEIIGGDFLYYNEKLEELNFENLKIVERNFVRKNKNIKKFNAPNLRIVGQSFLTDAKKLIEFNALLLEEVGDAFVTRNEELEELNFPNMKRARNFFVEYNKKIKKINFESLEEVGTHFLYSVELEEVYFENLKYIGGGFMGKNTRAKKIILPAAKEIGIGFFNNNTQAEVLNLPLVELVSHHFMEDHSIFHGLTETELRDLSLHYANNQIEDNNEHINENNIII